MNNTYIATAYVIIDDLLKVMNYQDDQRAEVNVADILMVAVVAAKYFQDHHERALELLVKLGYLTPLSTSRFSCRLHVLCDWEWQVAEVVGDGLGVNNRSTALDDRDRQWAVGENRGCNIFMRAPIRVFLSKPGPRSLHWP